MVVIVKHSPIVSSSEEPFSNISLKVLYLFMNEEHFLSVSQALKTDYLIVWDPQLSVYVASYFL